MYVLGRHSKQACHCQASRLLQQAAPASLRLPLRLPLAVGLLQYMCLCCSQWLMAQLTGPNCHQGMQIMQGKAAIEAAAGTAEMVDTAYC